MSNRFVIDIEGNSLTRPTEIWLVVCKDIDTGEYHVFRNVTQKKEEKQRCLDLLNSATLLIGHNILGYDAPVLDALLGYRPSSSGCYFDTLVLSKLVSYSREAGHSIEAYGEEFGTPKGDNHGQDFFKAWSQELENYCVRDVDICERIYRKYLRIITDPQWESSIKLEHEFQGIVNRLHDNGFSFNVNRAHKLLEEVEKQLRELDEKILKEFPPRQVLVRKFTPKLTKHGTISRSSVPRSLHHRISDFEVDIEYPVYDEREFNPSSHKQVIAILNEAGWKPVDKTQTHIETERQLNRARYSREPIDTEALKKKLEIHKTTGWKINETNLGTLPESAPSPARTLAKRILLEARRRTLTEWLGLVQDDSRIHGTFYGIGAWTHRMAHQKPNTANIPTDVKLYGGEMRSLWQAPRNRLLVGVDAEGIQLRIFAHYIDDAEFTDALVKGKKSDKTDPHSLNQRILGSVCTSRQIAKRFIYALLLGAGIGKLSQILGCEDAQTKEALARLLERYEGFKLLREKVIPKDARAGWFRGLDGRMVRIPGDTEGERKHLCMSGYLQNGEAVVMKKACLLWHEQLHHLEKQIKIVNFVHDEWQTEVPNNMDIALEVARVQADSLRQVGELLKLKCPLAGSYWNDDHGDYTIGPNWRVTH